MSKNNLELARNGDRVWLNYWDVMNGKDQVYELYADGRAMLEPFSEAEIDLPQEQVDLVLALRELARRIRD